jgi:hypothetical protein
MSPRQGRGKTLRCLQMLGAVRRNTGLELRCRGQGLGISSLTLRYNLCQRRRALWCFPPAYHRLLRLTSLPCRVGLGWLNDLGAKGDSVVKACPA